MKKLVFSLLVCATGLTSHAQYAGHDFENCSGKVTCGACYGTGNCYGYVCMSCGGTGLMNCAACTGYRQGKQMAEQMERNRRNNPNALWSGIVENLGRGIAFENCYEKAYEDAEILAEQHDDGRGYLIMGWMNEMGIGTSQSRSYAKKCYAWGADNGNKQCKKELQRINSGKYLNKTNEKNFKKYYADLVTTAYSISQSTNWNSGGSSNSSSYSSGSSTSGRTCAGCGGTGKCTGCSGEGKYWVDSGMYTGSGSRRRVNCGSCGGSGRCRVCHGKGKIQ